jgi:hypothetical protein
MHEAQEANMTTIVRPRSTKKYQTLIKIGYTDEQALKALADLGIIDPEPLPEFPVVQQLVASGEFTKEEAEALVASLSPEEPVHTPAPLTPKQQAEALVEKSGLGYAKGRVYANGAVLEAATRVLKTGTPEIAKTSGVGHITAVLVYREESGDVAIQNLGKPKE